MNQLRLKPHSVARLKLPTLFAEFNPDFSIQQKPFIDCSGCENNDAPESVRNALVHELEKNSALIWDHWNPQDPTLRKKIAELHKVDIDQVFITSGAIAGIDYCFKIFATAGMNVGLLKPDWPGFAHYADFYRAKKNYLANFVFPFTIDQETISRFVSHQNIDLMLFANPVPVQGNLILKNELEELLKTHPETLFVIDEADTVRPDMQGAGLAAHYDNAIFLGSFSKFYGLSGLRIGYLIAPKIHAEHFRSTINVIEVSSLAILSGNVVMDDEEYQRTTQNNVLESVRILTDACAGTDYQVAASAYCFAAYLYSEKCNPAKVLAEKGIKILEGQYFGLPDGIFGGRVNLSDPKKIQLTVDILRQK